MDVVKRQVDALTGFAHHLQRRGSRHANYFDPAVDAGHYRRTSSAGRRRSVYHPDGRHSGKRRVVASARARNNGRNLIEVRGELIPYIDLRALFHLDNEAPSIEKIVIVRQEEQRVGLVVDLVIGTHQTVIQPLGRFLRNIKVVSGATIMGDGRVALVMDIAAVVRFADCDAVGSSQSPSKNTADLIRMNSTKRAA